jgi:competence protein ComEC
LVSLKLASTKSQWIKLYAFLFLIFIFSVLIEYKHYISFIDDEIYICDAQILNIYPKQNYNILKLKTNDFTFFTSNSEEQTINIYDEVNIYINTYNISFLNYLKGFYTTSFNLKIIKSTTLSTKDILIKQINKQHNNLNINNLFQALFLATSLNDTLRTVCTTFGISHLIAISGFHLSILLFLLYWILYYPYNIIHNKYFPYRNRKFDIILIVSVLLLYYLFLTNVVPSLLRSFVMFIIGLYFLRVNKKGSHYC